MTQRRAIVWMSNSEASVFRFAEDDVAQGRLRADEPYLEVKHKSGAMQIGKLSADPL